MPARRRWLKRVAFALAPGIIAFVLVGLTQPRPLVEWLDNRYDGVVYAFDTPHRAVALTIDDSPTAHTPAILDALERHDARATFFVLGERAMRNPDLVRLIAERGHEPANHFYNDRPTILLGADTIERGLLATEAAIAVAAGDAAATARRWCRPGFGWYDTRLLGVIRRHDYRLALGSVYPHDTKLRSARLIAWSILRRVQPGDVIILHDRGYTAAVLERILPELSRRGYDVGTMSALVDSI